MNYGQTVGLYYEETTVTNDNLYSVYWKNFISEISDKDSRIVTATFYLTPDDIANFRFNDNIYIDDQYFKVNKIQNYNPAEEETCKVELIKTKFITVPRKFSRIKPNYPVLPVKPDGPVKPVKPPIKPGRPIGVISTNNTNIIQKSDSAVIGRDNFVYSSKSLTVGDNNTVSGERVVTFGDNNVVADDKIFIFGDNNTIEPGAEGSVIFGSNLTVTDPGTFVIGGKLVISSNYVNAGRNEILNTFPDNKTINYISASRNEVRELGSEDVINYIDGGRFTE